MDQYRHEGGNCVSSGCVIVCYICLVSSLRRFYVRGPFHEPCPTALTKILYFTPSLASVCVSPTCERPAAFRVSQKNIIDRALLHCIHTGLENTTSISMQASIRCCVDDSTWILCLEVWPCCFETLIFASITSLEEVFLTAVNGQVSYIPYMIRSLARSWMHSSHLRSCQGVFDQVSERAHCLSTHRFFHRLALLD